MTKKRPTVKAAALKMTKKNPRSKTIAQIQLDIATYPLIQLSRAAP